MIQLELLFKGDIEKYALGYGNATKNGIDELD